MAEKETKNEPKELIEAVPEELDKIEVSLVEKEQKSFAEEKREREGHGGKLRKRPWREIL